MSHSDQPYSVCIIASPDGKRVVADMHPHQDAIDTARQQAARQEILFCLVGRGLTQPQVMGLLEIVRECAANVAARGQFYQLSRALQKWAPEQGLLVRHTVREMGYGEIAPLPSWTPA